ncbi:hydroxyacid dehydrogenase [Agromyces protaetiae]|uniref:Hydroxyacid dehydrogenase n=1 Tax=Agromyces protaetiae TaxID=2509455 RepID=A0A4P6FBS7_9MICO|nr:NAD(P)-dependent oxidoreductase [Agromyces protaetiae]QAY73740.1 hydroxyacid dehydrogenase [Agromyces protaetiae]
MSGATVLVTSRSFSSGAIDLERRLLEAGHRVVRGDTRHDLETLAPVLSEASAWIAGTAPVTAALIDAAPALRVIARYGVGFDAVDVAAAERRGIAVTNTPGANSESVADLALALLLASLRTVGAGDHAVRRGDWAAIRGREVSSLTVGVAGFGRIGRLFADRARALGASVVAFDPFLPDDATLPAGVRRAHEVAELAVCDAVSLHAPGGRRIVDADWLANARDLALVNTARADLVDEAALAEALRDGRVASYAGDTLDVETATVTSSADVAGCADVPASPLLAADLADRVLVTPHLGAQTVQAIDRMGEGAVDNVLAVLAGLGPVTPVAAPAPAPAHADSQKVLP